MVFACFSLSTTYSLLTARCFSRVRPPRPRIADPPPLSSSTHSSASSINHLTIASVVVDNTNISNPQWKQLNIFKAIYGLQCALEGGVREQLLFEKGNCPGKSSSSSRRIGYCMNKSVTSGQMSSSCSSLGVLFTFIARSFLEIMN